MQLQNLENTITSASQGEWTECPGCGSEVRPFHIDSSGHCFICYENRRKNERAQAFEQERASVMAAKLGGYKALSFTYESFVVAEGNQDAFDAASGFDFQTDNLYLFGACGTGKTHLACMVAREAIEKHLRAEYIQPGRLLRRVRGKTGAEEQAEIDRLAGLDVLVLDDLGAEKDTEYAIQILYEVVDGRVMSYRNGLVITSNLPLPELARKLGDDRLPSRLAGLCKVIEITGNDWRLTARP